MTIDISPEAIVALTRRLRPMNGCNEFDDAVAMIDTLAARLAEGAVELAKTKTRLADRAEMWIDERVRAENLMAERDTALAQVAAAFEAAATCTEWTAWGERHNLTEASRRAVRALTPTDSTAALTAMIDRARGEIIEAAVKWCRQYWDDGDAAGNAIRAMPLPTPARTYEDGLREGQAIVESAVDWNPATIRADLLARFDLALIAKEPDNG